MMKIRLNETFQFSRLPINLLKEKMFCPSLAGAQLPQGGFRSYNNLYVNKDVEYIQAVTQPIPNLLTFL